VGANLASGGQTFAKGAELVLYGPKGMVMVPAGRHPYVCERCCVFVVREGLVAREHD
jgi:hypothetical protein